MNEKHVELLAEALDDVCDIGPRSTRKVVAELLLASEPFRRLLDGVREEERAGIRAAVEALPGASILDMHGVPYNDPSVVERAAVLDCANGGDTVSGRADLPEVLRRAAVRLRRGMVAEGTLQFCLAIVREELSTSQDAAAILDRALGGRSEQP